MTFSAKLRTAQTATGSLLCVGLDPDPARMPPHLLLGSLHDAVREFCVSITNAVAPFASAFKPNLAFFEALGPDGWHVLKHVLEAIPKDRVVILDAKRGDIGNTAARYAHALYYELGGDAATVAPYMGRDSIIPFLQDPEKCAFVLAATSNESAAEVQQHAVNGQPLYERVARMAVDSGTDQPGTIGLVVGATRPALLADLRAEHPHTPFLAPGIGAQGGSVEDVLAANAGGPLIVNSSRDILYASGGSDYAEAAAIVARELSARLPA